LSVGLALVPNTRAILEKADHVRRIVKDAAQGKLKDVYAPVDVFGQERKPSLKEYPAIPQSIGTAFRELPNAYVFDKVDGSNLRFEWSKKKGWHKFGTLSRLFDQSDWQFGRAIRPRAGGAQGTAGRRRLAALPREPP
jgi:hypothetical protein